jgi:hypothetical protein
MGDGRKLCQSRIDVVGKLLGYPRGQHSGLHRHHWWVLLVAATDRSERYDWRNCMLAPIPTLMTASHAVCGHLAFCFRILGI